MILPVVVGLRSLWLEVYGAGGLGFDVIGLKALNPLGRSRALWQDIRVKKRRRRSYRDDAAESYHATAGRPRDPLDFGKPGSGV